eukprot:scaffold52102_cov56-Prasinocladus_malaysianus.AAC.1
MSRIKHSVLINWSYFCARRIKVPLDGLPPIITVPPLPSIRDAPIALAETMLKVALRMQKCRQHILTGSMAYRHPCHPNQGQLPICRARHVLEKTVHPGCKQIVEQIAAKNGTYSDLMQMSSAEIMAYCESVSKIRGGSVSLEEAAHLQDFFRLLLCDKGQTADLEMSSMQISSALPPLLRCNAV